ncbi:MAG: hypothetical protein JW983_09490 [Elusimicrobia bacterium]|nr:hypothetical protein [Elusimicrobiota bacterium]
MKGIKKFLLSLLVLICFLFFIALILIKTVFPSNILINFAKKRIYSITGNKSEIRNVSVSLKGIIFSDIRIFYKDGSEITVKKLIIAPNLFPFPRKQIAINEIKIINPEVTVSSTYTGDIFKLRRKFPRAGYTFILSKFCIVNGAINLKKFRIDELKINTRNASIKGFFPTEVSFNALGANFDVRSECNFGEKKIIIKKAIIRSNKESVFLSGEVENFFDPEKMSFNIGIEGSGALINEIFLSNLHKNKIIVFGKKKIKLNIYGTLKEIQIKN